MSSNASHHTQSASAASGSVLLPPPPPPITRRVVSECDHPHTTQSLPANSTITPNLCNPVRQRVRVTSALTHHANLANRRSRAFEHERRFDDEPITSDTLTSDINHLFAPAQYAEQWQSLAHFFHAPEQHHHHHSRPTSRIGSKSKRLSFAPPTHNPDDSFASFARPSSFKPSSSFKLRSRTSNTHSQSVPQLLPHDSPAAVPPLPLSSTSSVASQSNMHHLFSQRLSISEDPQTMLPNHPDHTPLGEVPLLYSTQHHLFQTHSDSDSDTQSESDSDCDQVQPTSNRLSSRQPDAPFNAPAMLHHNRDQTPPHANQTTSHSSTRFFPPLRATTPSFSSLVSGANLSLFHRSIFKCALAYLLASLFTYSPTLSRWLASFLPNNHPDDEVPFSNLHMIATVAVYFHPAKTLGAMVEADMFALGAFVYAVTLGFCSMALAVFLHETDRIVISDIISVLVFLGLGMALVGYAKIKVAKPQFNTACSLISIIVFTVVVKEGSVHLGHFSTQKTLQVTLVVLAGSFISNLVCFYVWPQSATSNLQRDIVRNLRGFSTLLRVLTKTFLLEDPGNFHFKSDRIKRAIDDHHDSFTSLKKNLEEAKLESLFDLRMRGMSAKYVDAVDSLNRLAQHLTGLRSSCGLQHQIMAARSEAQRAAREQAQTSTAAQSRPSYTETQHHADVSDTGSPPASSRLAHLFESEPDLGECTRDSTQASTATQSGTEPTAFEEFIASIAPHMRSLVFSCCRTLRGLRSTFVAREPTSSEPKTLHQQPCAFAATTDGTTDGTATWHDFGATCTGAYIPGTSFDRLQTDISNALRRFQHEQTVAIKRIYTMEPKKLANVHSVGASVESHESVNVTRDGGVGVSTLLQNSNGDEDVFLIFFFVFNLEEFAHQLEVLVEALEQIRQAEERIALARQTSRWMRMRLFLSTFVTLASECVGVLGSRWSRGGRNKYAKRTNVGGAAKKMTTPLDFPSNRRHAINTDQTPRAMTWKEKLQRVVWNTGELFRQPDTKFAIKAGVGSALLASPAFFPSTRAMFTKFQGQWALVSFMVVLSPTVGQSNHMSVHRMLGTMLGACAAVVVYKLFPHNNVVLPLFGVIFSIACFRYIVGKPQLASSGRFVLLTYNLTALYSYNLRKTDVEVEQIAYQRTVSVMVGVLWATVLNQLIWPFEARRQLALGVSDVLFKLAWLYQRLVLSYSRDASQLQTGRNGQHGTDADDGLDGLDGLDRTDSDEADEGADEETALLGPFATRHGDELQAIELHLQVSLIKLEALLAQTKHEPRLKGPFPVATYRSMLSCCQNILDKLHSMRCVTTRQDWYRHVRRDFVIPVNAERREMVGNVLLYFYTLGSAFHLKSPVPPYFPPAAQCRARLLDRIRQLPVVKRRAVRGSSAYLLYYSYALAMKDVIDQLDTLGSLTQQNFGVWGGKVQDFERHFISTVDSIPPSASTSKPPSRSHLGATTA